MDSVSTVPGINDNYSGSATILEIALQMANLGIEPHNKLRFAFLDAKEFGLACDTFGNVSLDALDQMSNAAAHAVLTLADTT